MKDFPVLPRVKYATLKRWALKIGLYRRADSLTLHNLIADKEKLTNQFKFLEMLGPEYQVEIRESDKVLAHQLLQIANAYGLRYYGSLNAGHLHFGCSYPEYTQIIRIYVSGWPKGAQMRLDFNSSNGRPLPETIVGLAEPDYEAPITPPVAMAHRLLDLLAISQKVRMDFYRHSRRINFK